MAPTFGKLKITLGIVHKIKWDKPVCKVSHLIAPTLVQRYDNDSFIKSALNITQIPCRNPKRSKIRHRLDPLSQTTNKK